MSRESLFSDEEEQVARAIAAPLNHAKLKGLIQQRIQEDVDEYWREKISSLIMQGDFMSLLVEEDNCITWKSFIWSVPRGVAKFAVNAGLNTLPSADNLKRWGKRTSDLCTVCYLHRKQTLNHILSTVMQLSSKAVIRGGTIKF